MVSLLAVAHDALSARGGFEVLERSPQVSPSGQEMKSDLRGAGGRHRRTPFLVFEVCVFFLV